MKIDMPHSCEVTADRIFGALQAHWQRLSRAELYAMTVASIALRRIAAQDRIRLGEISAAEQTAADAGDDRLAGELYALGCTLGSDTQRV